MLYRIYQAQSDLAEAARFFSSLARGLIGGMPDLVRELEPLRTIAAGAGVLADIRLTHERPDFEINSVEVDGKALEVREEVLLSTPFGDLLHFKKEGGPSQPKVLMVAPMACHFATLLRDTIRTVLPEHDVYVTDWKNARDIPVSKGCFDLDDYIEHLMMFLDRLGPKTHLMCICQPCPAALAAVALMSEDQHPATPATLTLIAGPVDTRQSPTTVNQRAAAKSLEWFESMLIERVPWKFPGSGRRVYPGFLQISGFMGMNLSRHQDSLRKLYDARRKNDAAAAAPIEYFYREYLAVCDLPAEFYLQTLERIFKEHDLPLGRFTWRGRLVNPAAITKTPLLTIEGGRDDICGLGQTRAAIDLCIGLASADRSEYVEPSAGHYGVFAGTRWTNNVYPRVRDWIRQKGGEANSQRKRAPAKG